MKIYSPAGQLAEIQRIVTSFALLPLYTGIIPGAVMEAVLAYVRKGVVLKTYDFVDVVNRDEAVGWQVKSTKASTPVTWKRAKIPNATELIKESQTTTAGQQALGDAIITFCNNHARESMKLYNLNALGYSRLIVHDKTGRLTYFERLLCTKDNPYIFDPKDFSWHWSTPKATKKKEQLPALHGIHRATNQKWWAWHGLGENQLHFSGESNWWPAEGCNHFTCAMPTDKMPLETLITLLCPNEFAM